MSAPATRWEDVYATQTARITELERENMELRKALYAQADAAYAARVAASRASRAAAAAARRAQADQFRRMVAKPFRKEAKP